MRAKTIIIGPAMLTLLGQLLFFSPASATGSLDDSVPPTGPVAIDVVTANGSGCPPGTAVVAVTPGNATFTVTYNRYLAQIGIGAAPVDFRKNCQLSLAVDVPQGFTYAISRVDHRGYASLAAGATGMQRTSYYFQGSPATTVRTHQFTSPFEDNWQTTDEEDVNAPVYHPCGALRNLNINTELRVSAGTSDPRTTTSFLAMDSTDGVIYHFRWQQCP